MLWDEGGGRGRGREVEDADGGRREGRQEGGEEIVGRMRGCWG